MKPSVGFRSPNVPMKDLAVGTFKMSVVLKLQERATRIARTAQL